MLTSVPICDRIGAQSSRFDAVLARLINWLRGWLRFEPVCMNNEDGFARADRFGFRAVINRRCKGRETAAVSHAHWHQDVERARLFIFADQRRRCRVGKMDFDAIAINLRENIHEIAGVEANFEAG